MFQIIKHQTNFDFIGRRRLFFITSMVLCLAIVVGIATVGFNFGIDFAGGTLVEVKFDHSVNPAEVRTRAQSGGLADATVQRIGSADENSFLLRLGGTTQLTKEGAEKAKAALATLGEMKGIYPDLDNGLINFRSVQKVEPAAVEKLVEESGTSVFEVRDMGAAQGGGFDYQVVASGMADKIRAALSKGLAQPDYQVQRIEYVGPQVGQQLRNKGIMALIYAMIAILVYVAFRFDFKFGPGALVSLVHDAIMVSGYYLVSRREFNLTSIAALLTIIGYSVNDTIVIYDRIREEMVRFKGKPLTEIVNIAVNATLSRTLLTNGITAVSLIGLIVFAVGEIWDFAAAMVVGIIVGTYSSVFIASPLVIWLDERAAARAKAQKQGRSRAQRSASA